MADMEHHWSPASLDWNPVSLEAWDAKKANSGGASVKRRKQVAPVCQAPGCDADLSDAKPYFRRHCICAVHMKAASIVIDGVHMRYCQQCGHFEKLDLFVGGNRSCKMSLERRSAMAQASKGRTRDQRQPTTTTTASYNSADDGSGSGGDGGRPGRGLSPSRNGRCGSTSDVPQRGGGAGAGGDVGSGAATNNGQVDADDVPKVGSGPAAGGHLGGGHKSGHTGPDKGLSAACSSASPLALGGRGSLAGNNALGLGSGLGLGQGSGGGRALGLGAGGSPLDLEDHHQQQQQQAASDLDPRAMDADGGSIAGQGSLGLGLLGLGGLACSIGAAAVGPSPSPFGAAASLQHAQPLSLYPTHQQLHLHHHKDNSLRLLQQHRYQQSAGVRGGPGGGGGGALLASGGRCLSLPTRPTVFSAAGGPGACGSLAATMGTVSDPFLELQLHDIMESARLESSSWYGSNGDVPGVLQQQGQQGQQGQGQQYPALSLVGDRGEGSSVNGYLPNMRQEQQQQQQQQQQLHLGGGGYAAADGRSSSGASSSLVTCLQYLRGPGPTVGHTAQQLHQQQHHYNHHHHQQQQQQGGGGGGGGQSFVYPPQPQPYVHGGQGLAAMSVGPGGRGSIHYRAGEPDPLHRIALKLTRRSPDQLDAALLASLRKMLDVYDRLQSVQGYVRPGCTQLVLDLLSHSAGGGGPGGGVHVAAGGGGASLPPSSWGSVATTAAGSSQTSGEGGGGGARAAVAAAMASSTAVAAAAAAERMLRGELAEALAELAAVGGTGLTLQLGDMAMSVDEDGAAGLPRVLRDLPTIAAASCAAVSSDSVASAVTLYGQGLADLEVALWGRMHGVCYELHSHAVADGGVQVALPLLVRCGLLQLEAAAEGGAGIGPPYPLLVLPCERAVAEVHGVASAMGPASLRRFVVDCGSLLGLAALLGLPLNGVTPVQSVGGGHGPAAASTGGKTWGSVDSTCGPGSGASGEHSATLPPSLAAAAAAVAAVRLGSKDTAGGGEHATEDAARGDASTVLDAPGPHSGDSDDGTAYNCNGNSSGGGGGRLMDAADPTDGMTCGDDPQLVEQLLGDAAVRHLLDTAIRLLGFMMDRRLVHCTRAVLSALSELAQRFPHRLSARLAPPPPPPRSAFGLMHAAVRAGDPDAAAALAALEEVLGGHCSLLASGPDGVTPLHLAALAPNARQLLAALRTVWPGLDRALHTAAADDGTTPLQLYNTALGLTHGSAGAQGGAGDPWVRPGGVPAAQLLRLQPARAPSTAAPAGTWSLPLPLPAASLPDGTPRRTGDAANPCNATSTAAAAAAAVAPHPGSPEARPYSSTTPEHGGPPLLSQLPMLPLSVGPMVQPHHAVPHHQLQLQGSDGASGGGSRPLGDGDMCMGDCVQGGAGEQEQEQGNGWAAGGNVAAPAAAGKPFAAEDRTSTDRAEVQGSGAEQLRYGVAAVGVPAAAAEDGSRGVTRGTAAGGSGGGDGSTVQLPPWLHAHSGNCSSGSSGRSAFPEEPMTGAAAMGEGSAGRTAGAAEGVTARAGGGGVRNVGERGGWPVAALVVVVVAVASPWVWAWQVVGEGVPVGPAWDVAGAAAGAALVAVGLAVAGAAAGASGWGARRTAVKTASGDAVQ